MYHFANIIQSILIRLRAAMVPDLLLAPHSQSGNAAEAERGERWPLREGFSVGYWYANVRILVGELEINIQKILVKSPYLHNVIC